MNLITVLQLEETVDGGKIRKTPDHDDINMDLLKHGGPIMYYKLLDFLSICWKYGYRPDEWSPFLKLEEGNLVITIEAQAFCVQYTNCMQKF